MSVTTSVPDGSPTRRGRAVPTVLAVLAYAVQAFVLFFTFVMGLGWGGLTYIAALLQAGLAFVVITRLVSRRRSVVVLVPVLSAALTGALAFAGQTHGRATACSDQEREAAEQFAPPPGTSVDLQGEYVEGCVARTSMRLSNQQIVEHYQAEFARLGWEETQGVHESTVGVAAVKDGIHLVVEVNSGGEGGAQMFEVLVGDATGTSPCSVNTVDGFMQRQPKTGLEPGDWMALVSTDDGPASVVIRDSTGAVVLERQAHPRPDDHHDMERIDAHPGGVPPVALQEGNYEIECRHGDGAATTVGLPVAWAGPASSEQEKNVAVRVFETPDHWK